MKPLDLTKPLQTRDGRPAKFLHKLSDIYGRGYPIVCVVGPEGSDSIYLYSTNGEARKNLESDNDLINVPVKHVREYWVNCYLESGPEINPKLFRTRNEAIEARSCMAIACKKITIEFEENEGL